MPCALSMASAFRASSGWRHCACSWQLCKLRELQATRCSTRWFRRARLSQLPADLQHTACMVQRRAPVHPLHSCMATKPACKFAVPLSRNLTCHRMCGVPVQNGVSQL